METKVIAAIRTLQTAERKPSEPSMLNSNNTILNSPIIILIVQAKDVVFFQYNTAITVGNSTANPEKVLFTSVPIIPSAGSYPRRINEIVPMTKRKIKILPLFTSSDFLLNGRS